MREDSGALFPDPHLTFSSQPTTILHVNPEKADPHHGATAPGETVEIAEFLRRARAGEAEGYRQLFRANVNRLHRLVCRLAGSSAEVEDLVQIIFVEAFRGLPGFRGDSAFFTWLGRIAVRITLRHRRQARPRSLQLDERTSVARPSAEGAADARRALVRCEAILQSLTDKRRTAFVLHVLEGQSLEAVATMLDAKVDAIKVRVHDARVEIERQARRDPYLASYLQWEATP